MSGTVYRQVSAPKIASHVRDVQAILASGFAPLRHCTYWLLRVTAGREEACLQWLQRLANSGLVRSAGELGSDRDETSVPHRHKEAAAVAFSFQGLKALGLREDPDFPFPSAFRNGMGSPSHARSTGDDPPAWRWDDTAQHIAHVFVAHFRQDAKSSFGEWMHDALLDGTSGFSVVAQVPTCPSYIQPDNTGDRVGFHTTEPFGFRDGIAQPVIDGLRRSQAERDARTKAGDLFDDRVVAPGEFILGHPNQYGELAYCPNVMGWSGGLSADGSESRFATNGSYLAVRQIVQHVDKFEAMERRHPGLGEKLVGREKDGTPLVSCPFAAKGPNDAFRYRVADADGLQCPRGAHIRRSNPRDTLGWNVESGVAASKLHRILRRGRVYASSAPSCQADPATCGHGSHVGGQGQCAEGLFFMALNADIDRQFQFVLQRWVSGRQFNDLVDEDDFTSGRPAPRSFTVQGLPTGERIEKLDRFTETVGGGYFFLPGLAALKFIASGCRPPAG